MNDACLVHVQPEGHEAQGNRDFWWDIVVRTMSLDVERYVLLLTSYANGAAVAEEIAENVARVLGAGEIIELTDYVGLCVARKRAEG